MIRLRRAEPEDADRLAALDGECFGTPWPRDVWMQEITRPFAHVVIAEHAGPLLPVPADDRFGGVVGSTCVWVVGDEAHLLRIATHPTLRGRGVGADLLADVLARAEGAGCRQVLLEVARRNRVAIALYEKAGFRTVGERKSYYATPPDDALLMARELVVARR